jgi:hypothetical protein
VVTKRRYTPPWLPEPGHGDFVEERILSDAQIQLIQDWVEQGAPPGPIADAPPAPQFTSEWQLGTPDLVLHVTQPYQLKADGPEVFWNFIIPVPIKTARWVKAIEIRPGNARVIHHASVTAFHGAPIRAWIWCSTCICDPPEEPRASARRSAFISPTRRGLNSRC